MKGETGRLAIAVATTARSLPGDQVELVATVMDKLAGWEAGNGEALTRLVPTAPFRSAVSQLSAAWAASRETSGPALALALRAARCADDWAHAQSRVEVVWTGPEGRVDVRLTYAVLIEVVQAAREFLTLVSFAAYRVDALASELRRAAAAGTEVRIILDGGTHAARAFSDLGGSVKLYTWPPTLLDEHDPAHASLHAKAAIADDRVAFVTSANLTGHGMDRNMELGLLVRGGDVPRTLAALFDEMIGNGVLVEVT